MHRFIVPQRGGIATVVSRVGIGVNHRVEIRAVQTVRGTRHSQSSHSQLSASRRRHASTAQTADHVPQSPRISRHMEACAREGPLRRVATV